MDPDGKALVQLTGDVGDDDDPAWSPDGTRIAFSSNRGGTTSIYVMNADGSDVQRLSTGTKTERHPTWSPDGRFIAFMTLTTNSVIAIVDVATHAQVGSLSQQRTELRLPGVAEPLIDVRDRQSGTASGPRSASPEASRLTTGRQPPARNPSSCHDGGMPIYRGRAEFRRADRGSPWVLAGVVIDHRLWPAGDGVQPIRGRLPDAGLVGWSDVAPVIAADATTAAASSLDVARSTWPDRARDARPVGVRHPRRLTHPATPRRTRGQSGNASGPRSDSSRACASASSGGSHEYG